MNRKTWLMAAILATALALAGNVRANEDEKQTPQAQDPAKGLPAAVWEAATYHVPDLTVDDVSTRQVKGHPLVYIIDGESCDRDVVLAIEENGDIHEIRFHKRTVGVKPAKVVHALDELPDVVRETAERAIPDIQIGEVKSTQADGEQRIYFLIGTVIQDDAERHVTLKIEEDGDLIEARVIKPMNEVASADQPNTDAVPQRDPNDD